MKTAEILRELQIIAIRAEISCWETEGCPCCRLSKLITVFRAKETLEQEQEEETWPPTEAVPPRDCPYCDYALEEHRETKSELVGLTCKLTQRDLRAPCPGLDDFGRRALSACGRPAGCTGYCDRCSGFITITGG